MISFSLVPRTLGILIIQVSNLVIFMGRNRS